MSGALKVYQSYFNSSTRQHEKKTKIIHWGCPGSGSMITCSPSKSVYILFGICRYEQAFLSTMLFEKQADFWIGLNDRGREGWYWWTNNSPVKYTNWDANQPGHSNTLFDCIHMTYSRNHEGRWITAQCEQRLGYICERSKCSPAPPPHSPTHLPSGKKNNHFGAFSCF